MTNLLAPKKAAVDFTQEIRFAVVMYGGASLAIYMNGVAQELLRLVRATAPAVGSAADEAEPGNPTPALLPQVSGSEAVYRKLGRMLSRGVQPDLTMRNNDEAPIKTRFVIDILSGTSAGGINAVFLAKALANNQAMDQLKQMWIEQGDIGVLINDKASDAGINIGPQDPPRSLLNSRRMYYQLLDALERMDKEAIKGARSAADSGVSPLVDELDLFTTATDIWGQNISVQLADAVAHERRHLNTFHFRYVSKQEDTRGHNDFAAGVNPFLAFAARVTSAHPAPFEPMKLADIDEVLDKHESYRDVADYRANDPRWETFYESYLRRPANASANAPHAPTRTAGEREKNRKLLAEKFRTRPFSDGGVLDNSPFSFAIDKLQFRHKQLPVDRKLIYIEPVPAHPEEQLPPDHPPDALVNAWMSLSTLPSYQFIRDDLYRLLERNRLIERVSRILKGVEEDESARLAEEGEKAPLTSYQFGTATLSEMIKLMGSSWGGYQRLRVGETTDELVRLIARMAGFDEEAGEFIATRYLVRAWRDSAYDPYGTKDPQPDKDVEAANHTAHDPRPEERPDRFSQNWFLYQYDLKWRLRRLRFVMNKIDEIACFDKRAFEILRIKNKEPEAETLLTEMGKPEPAAIGRTQEEELSKRKRALRELRSAKRRLSYIVRDLHAERHQLFSREQDDRHAPHLVVARPQASAAGEASTEATTAQELSLEAAMEQLARQISDKELETILKKPTEQGRAAAATELFDRNRAVFDSFLKALNTRLSPVMDAASKSVRGPKDKPEEGILSIPDPAPTPLTPEYLVRRTLLYFYENFDRYDVISYPILYATNVGDETDIIEVFRISPEDAQALVKDRDLRRRKLAGTSLGNFGAFFDRGFRTNDILWGRLDSADRLITALLSSAAPQNEAEAEELKRVRQELIEEASRAIIAEEFSATNKASLRGLLAAAMTSAGPGGTHEQFIPELRKLLEQPEPELSQMQSFLSTCLTGTDPLQQFIQTSNFDHILPAKMMVSTSARASKVFGKMLEGIADARRIDKKRVVWITRLAQLFWGLVEVAMPDSIPNLIFRHWLKLLYLFEFLLVLGGTLLLNQGIQQFGLLTFGITAGIHAAVLLLSDFMSDPEEKIKETPASTGDGQLTLAAPPVGKKRKPPLLLRVVKGLAVTLLVMLAVFGIVFLFTVLWAGTPPESSVGPDSSVANIIWGKIAAFREWIVRPAPNGWNKKTLVRFSIVALVGLFFLWSVRSDLGALFKRRKKER